METADAVRAAAAERALDERIRIESEETKQLRDKVRTLEKRLEDSEEAVRQLQQLRVEDVKAKQDVQWQHRDSQWQRQGRQIAGIMLLHNNVSCLPIYADP